ncbi:PPOX class F420-dependent oxidoreductase [Pseudonocardia sp. GCM10023141]|uniref:PPOX class F420-dependent oxidoreductase n=1 Tax=Pseudonocardia sp. GCM10023141 TaxID=3252653 RepID=UPI003622AA95
MSIFTPAELAYLQGQRIGRLATTGPDGAPQVRPVGFSVDPDTGAIDIGGYHNPDSQKWRNIVADGRVAFVVDDVVLDPWSPRAIEVRGVAETLLEERSSAVPGAAPGVIRIRPQRILVFGVEPDGPGSRAVTH